MIRRSRLARPSAEDLAPKRAISKREADMDINFDGAQPAKYGPDGVLRAQFTAVSSVGQPTIPWERAAGALATE